MNINDKNITMKSLSDLYFNKICLAPMVRVSSCSYRVLSLNYGADLVWSEEIVDKRITRSKRVLNEKLKTIDYVDERGTVLFRTDPIIEKDKIIFQIGTSDPDHALDAAKKIENDVAGIDINMGCPMKFSLQGGMGQALLSNKELACNIIKKLRTNISIPVSAKIRILDNIEDTIDFIKALELAGVSAITVHLRKRGEESNIPARNWEVMKQLVDCTTIPLIANGDLYTKEAVIQMREKSGCASVMLARPTLINASMLLPISGKSNPLGQMQQFREYLIQCVRYDTPYQIVKYTIMEMMVSRRHTNELVEKLIKLWPDLEFGRMEEFEKVQCSRSLREICDVFGVVDAYDKNASNINTEALLARKFDDSYFDGASSIKAVRINSNNSKSNSNDNNDKDNGKDNDKDNNKGNDKVNVKRKQKDEIENNDFLKKSKK